MANWLCHFRKSEVRKIKVKKKPPYRRNAAGVMNGSGNEKLALAINDERAAVIGYIASETRVKQRSKETKQEKKEEDLHLFFV